MASFSNPSKTYAMDKLSKCATMVLLMCCYLYRKRSNTINVNAEAKEQGRDMQTPIDDSGIFIEVSRSAQASPSPRWSPSQGIPRKGQAPGRVTSWIAPGVPTRKWVSGVPSGKTPSGHSPRLHYQAFG